MKRNVFMGPKMFRCLLMLMMAGLGFTVLAGCEQPLKENETLHEIMIVPPLFNVEKREGINPEDGSTWMREKGDMIFWLGSWEKEEKYDRDGFRIYRKERNTFFPIYNQEIEENEEFKNEKGSVLIWPYESRRKK